MILLCQTDPTVGQSERRARRFVALTERLGARACPSFFSVYLFCAVRCSARLAFCLAVQGGKVHPLRAGTFRPPGCGLPRIRRARLQSSSARPLVSPCAAGPLPRGQNNTSPAFGWTAALRRYVPQSGDFLCKDRFFRAKNAFVRLPNGKKRRFFKFFAKYI